MLFVDIITPEPDEPEPSDVTQDEVIPDIFDYYDESLDEPSDEPSAKKIKSEKEIITITFNVIINGNDGSIIFQVKINFAKRVLVLKHNH